MTIIIINIYFLIMTIIIKTSLYINNYLECIYIHVTSTTARKAVKIERAFDTYWNINNIIKNRINN